MKFSTVSFFTLNFLLQAVLALILTPFVAMKATLNAGLYEFIITGTYIVLLLAIFNILSGSLIWSLNRFRTDSNLVKYMAVSVQIIWTSILAVSFYIFFRLGIHLDHPVVLDLLRLPDGNWGINPSLKEFLLAVFAFAVVVRSQCVLLRYANKKWQEKIVNFFKFKNFVRVFIIFSIFSANLAFMSVEGDLGSVKFASLPGASYLSQVLADSLVVSLREEAFPEEATVLNKKPDVVIVMADAFRHDYVTRDLTPEIYHLRTKPNCAVPSRHYPGSHLTSYGGFSLWHGMDSYLYRPMTEQNRVSMVLKNLRENGYSINAFDASGLTSYYPPVVQPDQFDHYETFVERLNEAQEDVRATSTLIESWKARDKSRPYVGFLFLYSTHEPYFTIPSTTHTDMAPHLMYKESVKVIDSQVGRLLKVLPEETIFIFTSDHGEEFGEFGSAGHVEVRFEDVRMRSPFVFCLPGHRWENIPLSSHADIWPTIFDWAGASQEWNEKTFSGRSLLKKESARRWIPLTGAYFPSSGRELALVLPEGKVKLHAFGKTPAELKISGRLNRDDRPQEFPLPGEQDAFDEFLKDIHKFFY